MERLLYEALAAVDATKIGIPKVDTGDQLIQNVVAMIYTVIGALAIFYIIRGALLFVTASGDPNDIKQAKMTVLIASVSLILATSVFLIVNFFIQRIGG